MKLSWWDLFSQAVDASNRKMSYICLNLRHLSRVKVGDWVIYNDLQCFFSSGTPVVGIALNWRRWIFGPEWKVFGPLCSYNLLLRSTLLCRIIYKLFVKKINVSNILSISKVIRKIFVRFCFNGVVFYLARYIASTSSRPFSITCAINVFETAKWCHF